MTTRQRAPVTLRPFTDGDYDAMVAISNESYPDYAWTVAELRHMDDDWTPEGYFRRRMIADEGGGPVGYCDVANSRGQFVAENFSIDLVVRPAGRRRGIGTALFEDAVTALKGRRAHWVRARYVREYGSWRYVPGHWSNQTVVEGDDYRRWRDEHRGSRRPN